jgi:[ribosomal protein S5]-alanine N-acetyltransferase
MLDQNNLIDKFSNILPKMESESDIYFEHFSMDGLEEMHQYSIDERLYEFFEFEPFKDIDETKAYVEKLFQRMSGQSNEKNSMYWFVRRKNDDRLVGSAALVNLNYNRQSIEWGYGIDPELWGFGYVLKMQEILKYFTFEVLELNRLHGVTMVANERTIQSVLASDMMHEGILRDFYCKNGTFYDGWQYGMIAKDYFKKISASFIAIDINEIITVVSSVLTEEDITNESSMQNTLSWDSLNHMAIVVALKNQFFLNFSPLEISQMTSVKNIYKKSNESK